MTDTPEVAAALRERVARAMYEIDYPGADWPHDLVLEEQGAAKFAERYRRRADAAIAALRAAPEGEAEGASNTTRMVDPYERPPSGDDDEATNP